MQHFEGDLATSDRVLELMHGMALVFLEPFR